jgi:hypothetical protein
LLPVALGSGGPGPSVPVDQRLGSSSPSPVVVSGESTNGF